MTLSVEEIAVSSGVVYPIELSLPHKQICLAQRPSLCHGQSLELASNFDELVVLLLEIFINLALSNLLLAHPFRAILERNLLLFDNLDESQATVE